MQGLGGHPLDPLPNPLNSLLILLGLVFTGALVGGIAGLVAGMIFTGVNDLGTVMGILAGHAEHLPLFRIVQGFSAVGMFMLPPVFLGMIEGNKWAYIRGSQTASFRLYLLTLIVVLFSGPVSDLLGKVNEMLILPESWAGLEEWMRTQEDTAGEITLLLLNDTSFWGLIGNLIVIAAIAAIGEEFLFRGALQTIFQRWTGNPHAAIWITAIIFSAVHLQFYGFLPRLYLGVLFGYLFFWSQNLWVPIFAHFVNNASVVLITFIIQKRGHVLDQMDYGIDMPDYVYFISFAVVGVALYQYWRTTQQGVIPIKRSVL